MASSPRPSPPGEEREFPNFHLPTPMLPPAPSPPPSPSEDQPGGGLGRGARRCYRPGADCKMPALPSPLLSPQLNGLLSPTLSSRGGEGVSQLPSPNSHAPPALSSSPSPCEERAGRGLGRGARRCSLAGADCNNDGHPLP